MKFNNFPYRAVIVTGGSSGIGACIIRSILNIHQDVLICNLSRTPPAHFSGQKNLHHFPCDLVDSQQLKSTSKHLIKTLEEYGAKGPVLFINNSGYGTYAPVNEANLEEEIGMIDLNIRALVSLTKEILPIIVKQSGAIVNIASTAAFQATPYFATYGASKAFVLNWSLALREELKDKGVKVMAVCPGPTSTNFHKRAGFDSGVLPEGKSMKVEQVVDEILKGIENNKAIIVTGTKNRLLTRLIGLLPRTWAATLAGKVLKKIRLGAIERQ